MANVDRRWRGRVFVASVVAVASGIVIYALTNLSLPSELACRPDLDAAAQVLEPILPLAPASEGPHSEGLVVVQRDPVYFEVQTLEVVHLDLTVEGTEEEVAAALVEAGWRLALPTELIRDGGEDDLMRARIHRSQLEPPVTSISVNLPSSLLDDNCPSNG
jgi:hypothetical protein